MKKLLLAILFGTITVTPAFATDGGAAERMKMLRQKNVENVQKIRNEKKQALIKKIDARLCEIRKNRAVGMGNQIRMMNDLLVKIVARGTADQSKIDAAKSAIADARVAVDALSSEDCGVHITTATESAVGAEVRASIKATSEQWKTAQDKIMIAKAALRELFGTVKSNEKSQ